MAVMYPRELLPEDVKSPAEAKVFERLHADLPDEWEAFHSASWISRDRGGPARDGEIDFVLVNRDEPVVCLEVKGGALECRHGEWRRIEHGKAVRMRDPFGQALDHRYDLSRKLASGGIPRAREIDVVHAVALPDVTVHSLTLAPDAPRQILLDRHDVRTIAPALRRVLDYHAADGAADGSAARIREMLAPTVELRVPMAERFLEEEEAMVRLTAEQSLALSRLGRNKRLAVYGCAGSGKTMLGVEHARRLARAGKRVGFVCFNRALAEHLAATDAGSGVEFVNFHRLCARLAHKAQLPLPQYPKDEAPADYFDVELPEAAVEAAAILGPQFDAIIVDEAQDLRDSWFTALEFLLADGEKGSIWLFLDDNQRVYEGGFEPPSGFLAVELSVNCRTTQSIHREVVRLYRGEIAPEAKGPPGRDVEFYRSADPRRTIAGVIERLCGDEEVVPQDVVVLSAHGWDNSEVARGLPGRFALTRKRGEHGHRVLFSSIRGFKGLESPVVILCELEDLDEDTRQAQLYVGLSRARNHCVVVLSGAVGDEPG